MRSPLLPVLAALALGLVACDTAEPSFSDLVTGEAEIAVGETAVVDGVTVTFVAVDEDSRCPDTAMCVWPGLADVALELDGTAHSVRVVDPDLSPGAGVRVVDVVVYAVALAPHPPVDPASDETPVVTVATVAAD